MPVSVLVKVVATEDSLLPPFTGSLIRGLFFKILEDYSPGLGSGIHETPKIKPYSIKPLKPLSGKKGVKNSKWHIKKGEELTFGFGILDPNLEAEVLHAVVSMPDEIRIGKHTIQKEEIKITKISYERLMPGKTIMFFGITFKTPTSFKSPAGKAPGLFPEPQRIFHNLVNIWNEYAGEDLTIEKEQFIEWIEYNVHTKHYKLQTREIKIENYKVVGFKGIAAYLVTRPEDEEAEYILALLRLALISNIGTKRTYGMGVITAQDIARKTPITLTQEI